MTKKAWLIFVAVVVLLLGGLIYLSNKNKVSINTDAVNTATIQQAAKESGDIADHVFGKTDSKVAFIEYGDYQCPGCGGMYPTVKELTEKYQGQIAFVFRNFPLTTIHPNARAAATAAEAAGLQGKYWQMHDALYESQSSWEGLSSNLRTDFFVAKAQSLGLSVDQFKKDLANPAVNQKISFDQALGKKDAVNSTPSFFLNGKAVDQATWGDKTKLEAAITDALKAQGIALPDAK